MKTRRVTEGGIAPGAEVALTIDGERCTAHLGQTIAAVMLEQGRKTFRQTRHDGSPRGLYCGMGVCFDCIVDVDGRTERACMTRVADGMRVTLLSRFGKDRR